MACCGRTDLRKKKSEKELSYYERFAYLTATQQQAKEGTFSPSMCAHCDALTMGLEACIVCGKKKEKAEEKK